MNFPFYIAQRISLSPTGRKSSPAIKVSVAAVALSVAVMVTSVAIVLGFKREIRDKVFGFNAHISMYANPADGDNLITLTPSLENILKEQPFVIDYSLEASIPAILKTPDNFKGVYLRSMNGSQTHDFIESNLESGNIPDYSNPDNSNKLVLSSKAANELGLKAGDRIDTYFIANDVRVRRLEVAAIYNTHFDSYDRVIIYGALPLIQHMGGISAKQGTSIQIHTDNFQNINEYTEQLHNALIEAVADGTLYRYYNLDNALHQGQGYFQWLNLLDTNVAVVLTLMIIVAAATLISGMLILILDKRRFIGVMRALGTSTSKVRKIFIWLALRVGLTGMLAGNAIILTLLWAQDKWHWLPLDPEAYYIDFVPVELDCLKICLLNAGALAVIWLSLLLPSRFAAGISPAETMRTSQ
ncbi:MAG: FtsX-like permease family protein [Candidatus Amulumruptor caecigallinarius]|nr:FtsX-like permease family protein [Candidatus Amulumruptor caecigallinarius]